MSSLANFRACCPEKISDMDRRTRELWFKAVYCQLEKRAAGFSYEHLTVDNLTFLQENTCDDRQDRSKWMQHFRKIWPSYFEQLSWRFYSLSDYVKFHASFTEMNPSHSCTISLDETIEQRVCYLSSHSYSRCDISSLLYALDNRRSEEEGVESELKRRSAESKKAGKSKQLIVKFNGAGLSMRCCWDGSNQRPLTLTVTGPLGVVLKGTKWYRVMNFHANKSVAPSPKPEILKIDPWASDPNYTLEELLQMRVKNKGRGKWRDREVESKRREEEVQKRKEWEKHQNCHEVCCHDIPNAGWLHFEADGHCWEVPKPQ